MALGKNCACWLPRFKVEKMHRTPRAHVVGLIPQLRRRTTRRLAAGSHQQHCVASKAPISSLQHRLHHILRTLWCGRQPCPQRKAPPLQAALCNPNTMRYALAETSLSLVRYLIKNNTPTITAIPMGSMITLRTKPVMMYITKETPATSIA